MKKIINFKFVVLAIAFVFILSGCSFNLPWQKTKVQPPTDNIGPKTYKSIEESLAAQSKIKKFESADELRTFLEENQTGSSQGNNVMEESVRTLAAPSAGLDAGLDYGTYTGLGEAQDVALKAPGSDDYSQTNVQVEGVDEADIVKTDGKNVYAVVNNSLYIVGAYPAENSEVLSKIEFEDRPQEIYIEGNRLVVFGQNNMIYKTSLYESFRRRGNYTFFKLFDISDPKNPKQLRDLDFEGSYSNSRMIGDYVYFVTNNYNYYYIDDEPVIPRIIEDGVAMNNDCTGTKCFVPGIYYFDIPYNDYNMTTITAINIKDEKAEIKGDVYLMSYGQNMYVSQNNIYITYTKYVSEYQLAMQVLKEILFPRLSANDQEKISKIEATENFILSQEEKMQKIGMIIERFRSSLTDEEAKKIEDELQKAMEKKYQDLSKELEKTVIHKIAIDKNSMEYKAAGEVTGSVLNQFSMDENKGYFRIATTKNQTWSQFTEDELESYNNLYVLDDNLKVVGFLENLAEGERIYSVRFMQNRAYLVTFKQMDPLFAIDLSDPKNPKVLGKLKIPGFSNYLHPYNDNLLIGIGKDTQENEFGGVQTKGLKLSLFDVSNVGDPKEVDVYLMGDAGSDSIALQDHKAFLFSKDKNLLVIPVSIRESDGDRYYGKLTFSGAAVFSINEKGFELKGKIDHSDGGKASAEDYWGGYNYYDNTVKRSLYIENNLYTFSNKYLKINKISDLGAVKNVELKKDKSEDGSDFEVIN